MIKLWIWVFTGRTGGVLFLSRDGVLWAACLVAWMSCGTWSSGGHMSREGVKLLRAEKTGLLIEEYD